MPKSLFISFILVCFLAACKKQNDNNPPKPSIIGKWNHQRLDLSVYYNGQAQPVGPSAVIVSSIVFNADSTFTDAFSGMGITDTTKGNFRVSGDNLSFSNTTNKGNAPSDVVVPSPLPLFYSQSYTRAKFTVSIKIKQLTASALNLHTEVVAVSAPDTLKEVMDEYYTK